MQQSRAITQKSASNLALSFILVPEEQRDAMSALYAFCRCVDDIADEDGLPPIERRAQLKAWREDLWQAYHSGTPKIPVIKELQDPIHKYKLPFLLFDELLHGVEMDLDVFRYETMEDLELYCYRVASVVGLLSIEIFGYQDNRCREYALYLGKALQLTNILRDVQVDARRGRIYLPLEFLEREKVTESEVLEGEYSERYFRVASAIDARARHYFSLARRTLPVSEKKSMMAAELMARVYWRLLMKLEAEHYNVFQPELIRVSKPQKVLLIIRSWMGNTLPRLQPEYGAA